MEEFFKKKLIKDNKISFDNQQYLTSDHDDPGGKRVLTTSIGPENNENEICQLLKIVVKWMQPWWSEIQNPFGLRVDCNHRISSKNCHHFGAKNKNKELQLSRLTYWISKKTPSQSSEMTSENGKLIFEFFHRKCSSVKLGVVEFQNPFGL